MMREISKKELALIKKNYFNARNKTRCKKCEQTGGTVIFRVNGKPYKVKYKATQVYTDFKDMNLIHNTGFMHKGNKTRIQDFYGKTNYTEQNLINKIDKKGAKK